MIKKGFLAGTRKHQVKKLVAGLAGVCAAITKLIIEIYHPAVNVPASLFQVQVW